MKKEDNIITTKNRLDNLKKLLVEKQKPTTKKSKSKSKSNAIEVIADKQPASIENNKLIESEFDLTHYRPLLDTRFNEVQLKFLNLVIPMKFNITHICNEIGINRQNFYNWMTIPDFKN